MCTELWRFGSWGWRAALSNRDQLAKLRGRHAKQKRRLSTRQKRRRRHAKQSRRKRREADEKATRETEEKERREAEEKERREAEEEAKRKAAKKAAEEKAAEEKAKHEAKVKKVNKMHEKMLIEMEEFKALEKFTQDKRKQLTANLQKKRQRVSRAKAKYQQAQLLDPIGEAPFPETGVPMSRGRDPHRGFGPLPSRHGPKRAKANPRRYFVVEEDDDDDDDEDAF